MNKLELIDRLRDIEWENFEVKSAVNEIPKNVWRTVSAFANTSGGWLIFGVEQSEDDFIVKGVRKPEKIEQEFTTTLRGEKFNQKIIPKCKKYNIENKIILAFYIPLFKTRPVYYNTPKNSFIRTASGNQRLTKEEIDSLFRQSAYGTKDRELTNLKIEDLDEHTLRQYRSYLRQNRPEHHYNLLDYTEFLTKIGVIRENKVTLAGLLMFGTEGSIAKYFSDFKIDYIEIPGKTYKSATTRFDFRLQDYPNIFQYFFVIFDRIIKKIDVPFKLKGVFRDENQPHVIAIREALVNLLIHSDYFSQIKPRIRVFTDRIEFYNPGALPKPYEELQKGDISMPRNPLITKMFRIVDLAESAGYGFDKMLTGWQKHYNSIPIITSGIDDYRIDFMFDKKVSPHAPPHAPPHGAPRGPGRGGG
ncbi:MAG: putative DNA binding domain-containing protein, partial [candidate division WOR-3 bacterium]|nr:putative DNA binding domain-containing protein [candidate division WOR-3 bacterium]